MRRSVWLVFGALLLPVALAVGLLGVAAVPGASAGAGLAPGSVPAGEARLFDRYGTACPTLTPARLAAQLYAESGFNPRAVSSAGAVGIAQFLPATWAAHGVDANGDGSASPYDVADAIASAAGYDCQLAADLRGLPGDPVDAMLAAYNAGPYAVLRFGGVPPNAETQAYVRRIRALEAHFAGPVAAPAPSGAAARAVAFAYGVLGTPYEWGGTGADGRFDCSGLTQTAYAVAGLRLPRVAADQWYAGPHVPRAALAPGDLVFYAVDLHDPATIHHVGLYVGGGQMIDAPYPGAVVRFDPVDQADYLGAVRPV